MDEINMMIKGLFGDCAMLTEEIRQVCAEHEDEFRAVITDDTLAAVPEAYREQLATLGLMLAMQFSALVKLGMLGVMLDGASPARVIDAGETN